MGLDEGASGVGAVEDLATLADRAAIHDVLMRYYRSVDRTDWQGIRDCFHPDADLDYGVFFRGDLDAFMEYLEGPTALGGFERTVHFAGNELIELEGDSARTETYCIAHHEPLDEHDWAGAFVIVWLRYVDRFERRDGAWRSARRKVAVEWVRKDEAGGWEGLPAEVRGRRDDSDPAFQI
jgi:hypothetical protein